MIITLRRSLEKELRETKEFLENVMESSVDGILTTDLKGKITYQNRAMEEILGYPKEEAFGRTYLPFLRQGNSTGQGSHGPPPERGKGDKLRDGGEAERRGGPDHLDLAFSASRRG